MGISTAEFEMLRRNLGLLPIEPPSAKSNKYNAIRKQVDGILFDSTKEAEAYIKLKALETGGIISGLKTQPQYLLIDGFQDGPKWRRPTYYIADFEYIENGATVVVDVKSKATKTPIFAVKWKLFRKRYPEIRAEVWE